MAQKDLGIVTAYGYAKQNGYTGTEEEFAELLSALPNIPFNASAASGTDDAKLYAAITALGWQSQVISDGDIETKKMLTNILQAISAENRLVTKTETISVPSTTGSLIKYGEGITLNAGVWVIIASVTFPANSTGYRRVGIGASDGVFVASRNTASASGGYETPVLSTNAVASTSTTTYYSYIQHNAGSTLSGVKVNWRVVRIA